MTGDITDAEVRRGAIRVQTKQLRDHRRRSRVVFSRFGKIKSCEIIRGESFY
jgi:predicted metalloenzyme YecM